MPVEEFIAFNERELIKCIRRHTSFGKVTPGERNHLKRRFESAPGVRRLGWTGANPAVAVSLGDWLLGRELVVVCDQGTLTVEEAMNSNLPTAAEIESAAREIREKRVRAGSQPFFSSDWTGADGPSIREIPISDVRAAFFSEDY